MDANALAEMVDEIVAENSGGVKFAQLHADILERWHTRTGAFPDMTAEELQAFIAAMPGVDLLYYSFKMSPDMYREKIFIYQNPDKGKV